MATETGAEVVWLPAASRATAVKVYDPFATLSVNAKTEYGCAGTSPPRLMTPFTLNWTPTTPTSSEAVAARVITPHMVDRKSTRLNSSHLGISYAVFCLKKKKKIKNRIPNITK